MNQQSADRIRTVDWQDPATTIDQAKTMSGLQYLQTIQTGELPPPPIGKLLGFDLHTVETGRIVFTLQAAEYHYNPLGTVHGGVAATLMDSAMGCAVQSTLPAGISYTTLELKVNYIRPITSSTGLIYCEGKIIHTGRRTATAEARITDETGTLYAHGTTTCLILHP